MRSLIDHLSLKAIRRLIVLVIGGTVILFGVVLSVPLIPGPGFVVIFAGLAILATEFVWARNLLQKVKDRVNSAVATVTRRNGSNGNAAETVNSAETPCNAWSVTDASTAVDQSEKARRSSPADASPAEDAPANSPTDPRKSSN